MRSRTWISGLATMAVMAGCFAPTGTDEGNLAGTNTEIAEGSPEADAVLALVNDATVDVTLLDDEVGLDARAASNIIAHRDGADGTVGTDDDNLFDDVAELDAIKYVGASALGKLLAYAQSHGYMAGGGDAPTQAQLDAATLALVNDANTTFPILDDEVGLDRRAAENIVAWRSGDDAVDGTDDDRIYATIAQLDDISYVGASALALLRDYAVSHGYLDGLVAGTADVVFSPQSYADSHNVRVAQLLDSAEHSVDIAMYSHSDAGISDAIEAAVGRGVKIRFVFETASSDKGKSGSDLENTKSARLEKMGVNVRYVNKIMHHKFAIVDGPRDVLEYADTATLATGSGNWSFGAATKYDENTLFLQGNAELTLRMQREFNLMWEHSRDFVYDATLPYELSTLEIDDAMIAAADTDASDAFFTSANFKVSNTTFSIVTGRDEVADQLVGAIENATDSIWVASGHLRSRPVSEALMAKHAADPSIDIRVYLDGQEYVSEWTHNDQLADLDDCLAAAGTSASKIRKCNDKGFAFSYQVSEAGIDVRMKYYAFRWDYSYAAQMHNKLMIIDGDELWTGSYNLSDNAEHNTFENMLVFRGAPYAGLIDSYATKFSALWDTRRDGTYDALIDEINYDNVIPLVFDAMALTKEEIKDLKSTISSNCPDVWSAAFKDSPSTHKVCFRD